MNREINGLRRSLDSLRQQLPAPAMPRLTDEQFVQMYTELRQRVERGEGEPARDGKMSDEDRLRAIDNIFARYGGKPPEAL